jgi:hypothetical protein
MGGQACVLYGAAEFSRDIALAVIADPDNLVHLRAAFDELDASIVAVPPLDATYLNKGHAVHAAFGDRATGRMRIDVMSRMRGVDPFDHLWLRRTTLTLDDVGEVDLLALPDLVAAKKTQRDKDWPMVRRLVEVNYLTFRAEATLQRVDFWLRELRTPALLVEVAGRFPDDAARLVTRRAFLAAALAGDETALAARLTEEEEAERAADRLYWGPLRQELEMLRRGQRG